MNLYDEKNWYASKGVWGGVVAAGAGLAGVLGYAIDEATQAHIVELAVSAAALVGGVLALIGRIKASKAVK